MWKDPRGVWKATADAKLEGKRGFLRLNARGWPELGVEGELSHNLSALKNVPQRGRLRVTTRAGNRRYDAEALVQMEECAVRARGAAGSQRGLQWSLAYDNNCSVIQVE